MISGIIFNEAMAQAMAAQQQATLKWMQEKQEQQHSSLLVQFAKLSQRVEQLEEQVKQLTEGAKSE